jgi:copper(I)-binding protein
VGALIDHDRRTLRRVPPRHFDRLSTALDTAAERPTRRSRVGALLFALALLGACANSNASREVSVSDAWALATVTGQPNGAVYFTVVSTESDTLQRVVVPEGIADHAEMHDTVTTADGAMTMQEMKAGAALDPGTAVTFTPGGKHVMLVDLAKPLVAGETFDVTLEFARADSVRLPVAVVEHAP